MKHFKYFNFDDVEVIAYCGTNDDDEECINFIAVGLLGTIELTPGFNSEEDRDEVWNTDTKMQSVAQSIANMVLEAFVPMENTNYE